MKSSLLASFLVASIGVKTAWAVAEWGQCGGTGYTGSTTCDAGLTCVYQNDFYYQCLKTSGATTTTKTTTTTTKATTTTTKATTTTSTSTSTSSSGAKGTPVGFAAGTTGGAGGVTVTPTTTDELLGYLADSTKRIIVLTKIFDFTSYYGTTNGKACKPWTCTNGASPQMTIDTGGGQCDPSLTLYSVTYYNSGANKALVVKSNKTIIGKGNNAGIKGIGLALVGVSNVIIQNIKITDLNPQYVWGGDAIELSGATNVWIDHNYIARVGRQFIVSHFNPNTGITISNNYFDGQSSYSTGCDGHHYWAFLFVGTSDQITMMQNHIYYTAGRGPHIGGFNGAYTERLHLVNNLYESITGHAIDADVNSWVLAEGNYFQSVKTPDTGSAAASGSEYFVQTVADASACSSYMGRVCEWNRMDSASGTVASRLNTNVLSSVGSLSAVKGLKPMSVADVPAYVKANRGVGIVN